MAVIMPTGSYRVLRRAERPEEEDEHGVPVPAKAAESIISDYVSGAVRDVGDGTWTYRLPVTLWPLYVDDIVEGPEGRFVVRTVKLNQNVLASALDYIGGVISPTPNPRR